MKRVFHLALAVTLPLGGCSTLLPGSDRGDSGSNAPAVSDGAAPVNSSPSDGAAPVNSSPSDGPAPVNSSPSDGAAPVNSSTSEDGAADAACTPVSATATDLYVGGSGTPTCPFTTITAALTAAGTISSVTTIHVASGTYSTGETFPLQVRGIKLVGAGAATTVVKGEGAYNHINEGGQFASIFYATMLIGSDTAPTTISGVTIEPVTISQTQDQHFGVFCDQGNITTQGLPSAVPPPNTFLTDSILEPGYAQTVIVTTTSTSLMPLSHQSGCNIQVTGTTFNGGIGSGIWALGGGLDNSNGRSLYDVALAFGEDGASSSNTVTGFVNPDPSDDPGASGLQVWDSVASLIVANSSFSASQNGILLGQHAPAGPGVVFNYFEVRTSTFTGMTGDGLRLSGSGRLARFADNAFVGNTNASGTAIGALFQSEIGTASDAYAPGVLYARRNTFVGNDNGVVYMSSVTYPPQFAFEIGLDQDWGTAADPGDNVFRCNSALADAGATPGFDVQVQPEATAQMSFVGNSWDRVPPTVIGSTAPAFAANGTDVTYMTGGTAPDASAPTLVAAACPPGRVP